MHRDVSWHSQYESFTDPERQKRGCGIVALKIAMEFWNPALVSVSADELYDAGLAVGGYMEGVGWKHARIVALARQYGFDGFNRDYAPQSPTPKTPKESFDELCRDLERGLVIASTWRGFDPASKSGHLVVVAGVEGDSVIISDPAEQTRERGRRNLPTREFLRGFRQRYICIYPKVSAKSKF